jgi:hypothetical protein
LFAPLTALADLDGVTDLLDEIGWDSQALGITDPSVFAAAVNALEAALDAITQVLGQEDVGVSDMMQALAPLGAAAASAVQALTSLSLPPGAPPDTLVKLGEDLLNYLFAKHFVSSFPRLAVATSLLGVLTSTETAPIPSADGQVLRQSTTQYSLDLAAVGKALADPLRYARTNLLLDPAGARRVADAIADMAGPDVATALGWTGLGASYGVIPPDPTLTLTQAEQDAAKHMMLVAASLPTGPLGALAALGVALGLTDDTNQQGLGLLVAASGDVSVSTVLASGTLTVTVGGALQPLVITGGSVQLASGASGPATFSVEVKYASTTQPAARFGSPSGTGLQIDSLQISAGVAEDGSAVDITGSIDLNGVALTVQGGDGDGFLSKVLPQDPIELRGDLGLEFSLRTGLKVRGSGTLEWHADLNNSIGPIELSQVAAALVLDSETAKLRVAATVGITLGPVRATVDAVGLRATLEPASAPGPAPAAGNAGPYQLTTGFKAPDGLGLVIDAGVAVGGGYIECDADKGQYAGVLELALESLSLTAIGLIQTKNADGTPLAGGYSFLVIISVEFTPGIEMGFGFSLNGVGGYLGLNRTMNADALRAGLHSGSLDDIMFPADPVGHAPQIIQELAGFFPAATGQFLIGPMVAIQWGSPLPLLTAELGVIVELPAPVRVAILGVLQVGLPQLGDEAVVLLNVSVLGLVDFTQGTLSLDASLYGSRIAEFPVTGDMALRLGWKAEREFIVSFGGCHRAQQLPPDFPATLNRLAICLSDSDKFVFTLQAYLAATSNTLQFGASAHLLAHISGARVDGMMSFDALIHTHPFGIQVDFAAAVTVSIDGQQLLGVNITGQLTGPDPWMISAQATISILGISHTVSVDFQLGSAAALLLPAPVLVIDLLVADVATTVNWGALPPPGDTVVTLTPAPPSGTDMRAHPLGSLTFHQHTVPLGFTIEKFGSADVEGPAKLALTGIRYGDSTVDPAAVTPVQDAFAPGQFRKLLDSDALSQPAFATYQAGVTFTPAAPDLDDLAAGDAVALGYTIDLIDPRGQLPAAPPPPLDAQAAARLVPASPAARAPTRTTGPRRYQGTPGTITVNPRAPAGRAAP